MHPPVLLPLQCCTCFCVMHTPTHRLRIVSCVTHAPRGRFYRSKVALVCVQCAHPAVLLQLTFCICLCVMHCTSCCVHLLLRAMHASNGPPTAYILHLLACNALHFMLRALVVAQTCFCEHLLLKTMAKKRKKQWSPAGFPEIKAQAQSNSEPSGL